MNYWLRRNQRIQEKLSKQTDKAINERLIKYYKQAMGSVIADFERVYNKVLLTGGSTADLYKLDTYWKMQATLSTTLTTLGEKQAKLLSREFERLFLNVYENIAIPGDAKFNTPAVELARTMVNTSWLADGKTFSQRIWQNVNKLIETLNEQLVICVVTGKKPDQLVTLLQERFNVSYRQATTLVRTEITHIQTQAAAERYKAHGLTQYEFLKTHDERTCDICSKLNGKKFYFTEMTPGVNAPPMHPNDRCTIIPVID